MTVSQRAKKNAERDARIIEAYVAGANHKDLATQHQVHHTRIYQILKAADVWRDPPRTKAAG